MTPRGPFPVSLWPSNNLTFSEDLEPPDRYLRAWIYFDRALLSIVIHFNSLPHNKCLVWGIKAYTEKFNWKTIPFVSPIQGGFFLQFLILTY